MKIKIKLELNLKENLKYFTDIKKINKFTLNLLFSLCKKEKKKYLNNFL